jgi:hypothetical protein
VSLTYPLDLLANFPGTSTRFDLVPQIELDPTRNGKQISKDIGPELWEADYLTRVLSPNEMKFWKARLNSLHGESFIGYDLTAGYPILYPHGSWPTGLAFDGLAMLNSVSGNSKEISLSDLPSGFVGSVGDYLSFTYGTSRALHQVSEEFFSTGSGGTTDEFRVRPDIRPGYNLGSGGTVVLLVRAYAEMIVVPGSISASTDLTGRGQLSFTGRQTL